MKNDGSTTLTNRNGSTTLTNRNGSTALTNRNGSTCCTHPNATLRLPISQPCSPAQCGAAHQLSAHQAAGGYEKIKVELKLT